jgi:hypothetical protein
MPWPTDEQPFGVNRVPLLTGLSSVDARTPVPVAVDPTNGEVQTNNSGGGGGGGGGTSSTLHVGQRTVSTSQIQISTTSKTLSNGVIIKSLSTNSATIYIGLTGVTTSTGDILEPGESRGYMVNNINLLYMISAASTTDIISYEGN